MSDVDEPPRKVTKIELVHSALDSTAESMDEGQEEWLSEEGLLTDDDFTTGVEQLDSMGDSQLGSLSQASTAPSVPGHGAVTPQNMSRTAENIEQALIKLENTTQDAFPDDLDAFLIRKTDGAVVKSSDKSEGDDAVKQSDDGNDTDELLRMLGEGEQKLKVVKVKQTVRSKAPRVMRATDAHSSDDEYMFEGVKLTRLNVREGTRLRPAHGERAADCDSDTDASTDEAVTVKKMFNVSSQKTQVVGKNTVQERPLQQSTPKPSFKNLPNVKSAQVTSNTVLKPVLRTYTRTPKKPVVSNKTLVKPAAETAQSKQEPEEIIDEAEFLEEDDFDLNEDEFTNLHDREGDVAASHSETQRILRPEQMDEEVPTDCETCSEDESLYDELPSSESDETDEWFTLDVRAECAADYLPLLGSKAHELLTKEKERVAARLTTLRENLSAVNESARRQAGLLRRATVTLAELDAMLTAS